MEIEPTYNLHTIFLKAITPMQPKFMTQWLGPVQQRSGSDGILVGESCSDVSLSEAGISSSALWLGAWSVASPFNSFSLYKSF